MISWFENTKIYRHNRNRPKVVLLETFSCKHYLIEMLCVLCTHKHNFLYLLQMCDCDVVTREWQHFKSYFSISVWYTLNILSFTAFVIRLTISFGCWPFDWTSKKNQLLQIQNLSRKIKEKKKCCKPGSRMRKHFFTVWGNSEFAMFHQTSFDRAFIWIVFDWKIFCHRVFNIHSIKD